MCRMTCPGHFGTFTLFLSEVLPNREALHCAIERTSIECLVGKSRGGDSFCWTLESPPFRVGRFTSVEYVQNARKGDGNYRVCVCVDHTVLL